MIQTKTSLLDQIIDPVARCFSFEVAQEIAALRASPEVQERLDLLSERSTEGQLSEEERTKYEACIRAMDFIGLLQAKARTLIVEVDRGR